MKKMKKKKKQSGGAAKPLSPEAYIRTKARLLPIYKCYKVFNMFEDRIMTVVVARKHPQGNVTFAGYLIDKWCLGVKDSLYEFNVDESELNSFVSGFKDRTVSIEEIDYVEAHNWVYGAMEFALEAGILPCKEFGLTRYMLEEDNDNVELREYEFGRDGEYCLLVQDKWEADHYVPILEKNLGKGNFSVDVDEGWDEGYYDDSDDDEDSDYLYHLDDDDDDEDFRPFKIVPDMEYSYSGGSYPSEAELNYPEVERIVMKQTEDISDDEMEYVLLLPKDKVREDLHNLILRELGRQWGKDYGELQDDTENNWCVVGNANMFLTRVGTVQDTLPVVLETMRQSQDFFEFNFSDCNDLLLDPVLFVLIKDNPRLLMPFLLEEGLSYSSKMIALELLEHIAIHIPQVRQDIVDMTVEVLEEYKIDLPVRKICDGAVVGFAIGILVGCGAVEHLPLIEELYETGLVDEFCEGHIEEVRESILSLREGLPLPPTDPYIIRDRYIQAFS